jgi:hypothetical protein
MTPYEKIVELLTFNRPEDRATLELRVFEMQDGCWTGRSSWQSSRHNRYSIAVTEGANEAGEPTLSVRWSRKNGPELSDGAYKLELVEGVWLRV